LRLSDKIGCSTDAGLTERLGSRSGLFAFIFNAASISCALPPTIFGLVAQAIELLGPQYRLGQ
jgi:hypothetical protein